MAEGCQRLRGICSDQSRKPSSSGCGVSFDDISPERYKLVPTCTHKQETVQEITRYDGANQKKTKIQNLSEGPETFGFFGFPRFFGFENRNPQNHLFFLILGGKPKQHRFFLVFLFGLWWKTKKTLCFFWISVGKPKNTMCFFGFLLENQNNPRKTKNSTKVSGPSGFGFLDFWFSETWSQYSAQHVIGATSLSLSFYLNRSLILNLSLSDRANIGSFNLSIIASFGAVVFIFALGMCVSISICFVLVLILVASTRVVVLILLFVLISVTVSVSVGVSVDVNANVLVSVIVSFNISLYSMCTNGRVNV